MIGFLSASDETRREFEVLLDAARRELPGTSEIVTMLDELRVLLAGAGGGVVYCGTPRRRNLLPLPLNGLWHQPLLLLRRLSEHLCPARSARRHHPLNGFVIERRRDRSRASRPVSSHPRSRPDLIAVEACRPFHHVRRIFRDR